MRNKLSISSIIYHLNMGLYYTDLTEAETKLLVRELGPSWLIRLGYAHKPLKKAGKHE